MRQILALFARIRGVFAKDRADRDLRAEMQAHLDMETAEYIRRGMAPDEARRQAMLASGGITQAVEAVRDQRGLPWLESIVADVRYALRALRHNRAFTAVVVLTLALGIGANTAIFSVVRGVLLRPLPHRDGDRLIYLRQSADGPTRANLNFSVPEVRELRAGVPALAGVAEYSTWFGTLQEKDDAQRLDIGLVTGNFFEIMGLSPVLGRLTSPADDGSAVPPVMVLSYDFFMKHYAGDASIVGKQITMNGSPVTVIGVLQPAPFFPNKVAGLLNMVASPHHLSAQMVDNRIHRMTEIVARLAPGATFTQAHTQIDAVYDRMQKDYAQAYDIKAHQRVNVIPFKDALGERAKLTLWLLMAAAAFVLIISAANVANLTLMRSIRREQELVVRAALGAGLTRLRRLLLAENLILTLAGGAFGVAVAFGGVGLLTSLAERYSPRADEIRLDGVVLAFTFSVAVALALLLSVMATLPKEGTFASIAAGAKRLTGSLRKHRVQRALVVAQVAVSVVLLAGAGLLTRTMLRLSQVDTGLRNEEVLTLPVSLLNPARISAEADAQSKVLYERMRSELAALPGAIEVGLGSTPLNPAFMSMDVMAENRPLATGEPQPRAEMRTADPSYFHAAGIPVLRGRGVALSDLPTSGKVVVLNQALADRLFPGEDPIGKRIAWTGAILKLSPFSGDWRTVVGIVGNTLDGGLESKPNGAVFMPFAQEFTISAALVVRSENGAALAAPASRLVRRIVPGVPIENVLTIRQIKDQSMAPKRLNAILVSSFGLLAVLIAAVGIAGVLAFSVSARTTEIGIRMSLGASRGGVQRMILREGGSLVVVGLVLGIGGAIAGTRALQTLLFGVTPRDPATFVTVAAVMAVVGLVACWIPALRASRIDPAITMRAS